MSTHPAKVMIEPMPGDGYESGATFGREAVATVIDKSSERWTVRAPTLWDAVYEVSRPVGWEHEDG